jgi:hypothetical protein
MAKEEKPPLPADVASMDVEYHTADGSPTNDADAAVSAEVVTTYKDGRVKHTLMSRN